MNRRMMTVIALAFTVICGVVVYTVHMRRCSLSHRAQHAYQTARRLCDEHKWEEGRRLLTNNTRELIRWFNDPDQWYSLILDCSHQLSDRLEVISLYRTVPQIIEKREIPSLWVCRYFISRERLAEYDRLREVWRGREMSKHLWFNLDIDRLVAEGRNAEARELLLSTEFKGARDAGRLVRCAFMSYSTDLTQALYYLQQAAVLAPKDPDIHLFSGQIFEAIRQNDKAEFQYKAAVVAAEQNPLYRSRLGDFYQRRNKVLEAIRAWDGGAEKLRPDFLSRKIYFWNKMVTGMALGENEQDRIRKTDAISVFLLSLPTNRFFNEHLYRQAGLTYKDMSNYQELFWLKLTDALQKKNEKAAFEALCDSKFSDSSFSIDILNGIKVVNTYRRLEQFPEKLMNTSAKSQTRHSFFRDLEACQYEYWLGKKDCVSQELSTLMKSPYGYSAVFLAGGWFNAAISLATGPDGKLKTFGRSLPQWYRYGMSVAVGKVFGPDIAMKILGDVQAEDRELYLLVSEHLLAMGRYKDAVARLQTLITRDDAPAYRAAFLLVNMHVASRRLVEAIRIINTVPSLAESDTGITLKARIFHSQGNEEKAQKLYERLASPTAEQKGYLLYRNRKLGNAEIAGSLMNGLAKEHGHNLSVRKYIIESLSHSSDQKGEKENVAQNTSETSGGTNE